MSVAPNRYICVTYREPARMKLCSAWYWRKHRALERAKLFHRLWDQPHSTTHENHCCREKPRDRLRLAKRPDLARERAERVYWQLPF